MPELRGKALSLKKALYGMRQAGQCWWKFLLGILQRLGFVATEVDQSLYIFRSGTAVIAIWIHVNDGVLASNSANAISYFKTSLVSHFDFKWSDQLDQIVGLECVFGEGEVAITQQRLTHGRDPFPVGQRLTCILGQWITADFAFAVNYLARHSMGPTAAHWDLLDHFVGYLKKTCNRGIWLCPGRSSLNLWSDAGWGGDLERSQTGFVLKLGDTPVLWGLKRQSVVALSTCTSEYVALSDLTQYLVQAINQLTQLAGDFDTTIFCDNQAAVQVSLDNKSRKRMRYLDRAFFFSTTPSASTASRLHGSRQATCWLTLSSKGSWGHCFSGHSLSLGQMGNDPIFWGGCRDLNTTHTWCLNMLVEKIVSCK
ncbi:hypothetical protein O181_038148 [Austropuccinia psidii MF-1]|uniref:Reverse transcriptase Ty1/copia-type domain-containing protein n=1 Tax=Austropuccinia psidii MF-1 TaxID=1389203 RepID=A0A9Q3DCS7_9BASI|nr:hypothetical protein [Austropuccinia psidii MF-1]